MRVGSDPPAQKHPVRETSVPAPVVNTRRIKYVAPRSVCDYVAPALAASQEPFRGNVLCTSSVFPFHCLMIAFSSSNASNGAYHHEFGDLVRWHGSAYLFSNSGYGPYNLTCWGFWVGDVAVACCRSEVRCLTCSL